MKIFWTNAELLSTYKSAHAHPGIYIIGSAKDSTVPIASSGEENPYLGSNWPNNFICHYVGISESLRRGIRGRLSSHARGKGSRLISEILSKEKLYYCAFYSLEAIEAEAIFLALKSNDFLACNLRGENERSAKRRYEKIRKTMSPRSQEFYDSLESEGDGM